MEIEIVKITTVEDLQEANEFTSGANSEMDLKTAYACRHSPMRTQLFKVKMYDIPTFVSVHLVRHSIGYTHFVKSMRTDRGGDGSEDRYTPVNHMMYLNAQCIIELANARLCRKASKETQEVVALIKEAMLDVDPALAYWMRPRCLELGRCRELKTCGYLSSITRDQQEREDGN